MVGIPVSAGLVIGLLQFSCAYAQEPAFSIEQVPQPEMADVGVKQVADDKPEPALSKPAPRRVARKARNRRAVTALPSVYREATLDFDAGGPEAPVSLPTVREGLRTVQRR